MRRLSLRGGNDSNTGVKKNFSNERLDDAKSRLKKILGANSQLERQVADLAASYDKLAKSYGLGSFKPTRTASYSCLNDVTLTEAADKAAEPEESKTPPVERIQKKIEAALAKDSKPVEPTEEVLPPEERLKIVIVSSEVAPFSKSGGLADVCDKLGVSSCSSSIISAFPSPLPYLRPKPIIVIFINFFFIFIMFFFFFFFFIIILTTTNTATTTTIVSLLSSPHCSRARCGVKIHSISIDLPLQGCAVSDGPSRDDSRSSLLAL